MTSESKSDFISGVVENNLNKIIGWVVMMLLAAIIAVPVMQYQIANLTTNQQAIDADLTTATRALVLLTKSVDLKPPAPRQTGLMGGGYDRKGALDDVMGKLQQRPTPVLPPKGDDDDSAAGSGDDDDSAAGTMPTPTPAPTPSPTPAPTPTPTP